MSLNPLSFQLAGGFAGVGPTGAIDDRAIPGNAQQIPPGPGEPPGQRFARLRAGGASLFFDPAGFARFNGEQVFNLVQNTSTQILAEPNTFRNGLVIRNASAGTERVFVSFGGGGASALSLLLLVPGDQIALNYPCCPQDIVYAFSPDAAAIVVVGFSNTPNLSE